MTKADDEKQVRAQPFSKRHMTFAFALMVGFSLSLIAWSGLAPLGSAVVAPGVVGVESNRKAVQHLEGGIVGRILVRDGDKVRRGDVVIEMRDVATLATVERLKSQYYEALAAAARLTAERDNTRDIAFPDVLMRAGIDEPVAGAAMTAQRRILQSRRDLQRQTLAVIDKRIDRLREEIDGLRRQVLALIQQQKLAEQEEKDAVLLFEKQLIRKPRVVEAQRRRAQLDERRSALDSNIAQVEQQINEQDLKKTEFQSGNLNAVMEEIRARQARAHELSRELTAAQDVLARSRIRAPIDGVIVGLQVHTRDGVIAAGQTLMEIVPTSDALVVDARIRPEDIQEIRAGLPASIVLNTLSRRYNQPLKGRLETVAADRVVDPLTGRPYYGARILLEPNAVVLGDVKLLAGMSADVFIQTGERTALAYLAAPLTRTFARGMREN